ncbi:MAG: TatD family hydrolase [Gammaproteobacteria bacterium]
MTTLTGLIDTHCHFDVDDFDADRAEIAARALAAGVDIIVIPGYIASQWPRLLDVCDSITQPRLLPVPGLHPCYVAQHEPAHLQQLEQLLQTRADIVAIGEIGLDYFVPELKSPGMKEKQEVFFRAQLELACKYHKPVVLHVRKAHAEVMAILADMKFREGGIVHAYSGGIEEAKRYVRLGFRLGIGGSLTYDQSKRLKAVVTEMPLDTMVLETDAPDMIPQPHRLPGPGRTRNSPEYLPSVAHAMSALKGIPLEEVLSVARQQSCRVLRLEEELR